MKSKYLTLLRALFGQQYGVYKFTKQNRDPKSRRKALGRAVLYAFVVVYMEAIMFFYIYNIAAMLVAAGNTAALIPLSLSLSFFATAFLTLFRTPGAIFSCRDFDLLMAMPVTPRTVVLSKLSFVYIEMLLYSLLMSVPCIVCYGVFAAPSVWLYVRAALLLLLAPSLGVAVGALLSFIITRISVGARFKNLLLIAGNLVLVLAIMYFSMSLSSLFGDEQAMTAAAQKLVKIAYIHPLSTLFESAVLSSSALAALAYIAASVGALLLVSLLIGRAFLLINSRMNEHRRTETYRGGSLRRTSPLRALYRKEMSYYFSQYMYVLNTALGTVFLLIGGALAAIKGPAFIESLSDFGGDAGALLPYIFSIFAAAILFTVGLTCTTACSISLEGRSFWILQTLPVPPRVIFSAKLLTNLTLTVPAVLLAVPVACVRVGFGAAQTLALLLLGLSCAVFSALLGLSVNLKHAKFDWVTPVSVIKQSFPVFITVLNCMIPAIALAILGGLLGTYALWAVLGLSAVYLAVSVALWSWLSRGGAKAFAGLGEAA